MELVEGKPAEAPKQKTLMEISGEYTRECFTYGDKEYKIRMKQYEIEKLNQEKEAALKRMNELDNEAAALKAAKKDDAGKTSEPDPAPTAPPEPTVTQ